MSKVVGTITVADGKGYIIGADGIIRKAVVGGKIFFNDSVETLNGAVVDLTLTTGEVLSVDESKEVLLDETVVTTEDEKSDFDELNENIELADIDEETFIERDITKVNISHLENTLLSNIDFENEEDTQESDLDITQRFQISAEVEESIEDDTEGFFNSFEEEIGEEEFAVSFKVDEDIDFTNIDNLKDIDIIEIEKEDVNIKLDLDSLIRMTDDDNILTVLGKDNDIVVMENGDGRWDFQGAELESGSDTILNIYEQDSTYIKIDNEIDIFLI